MSGESFLSRWSKKKVESRHEVARSERANESADGTGADAANPPAQSPATTAGNARLESAPASSPALAAPAATGTARLNSAAAPAANNDAAPASLAGRAGNSTALPPIESLTPESDFRPFMAQDVDPKLKNQALKALFKDPHYNVMDRLDIYIDDYTQPDPIPESMLRQLNQSKILKIFDDEEETEAAGENSGVAEVPPVTAENASEETGPATQAACSRTPDGVEQNDAPGTKSLNSANVDEIKTHPPLPLPVK